MRKVYAGLILIMTGCTSPYLNPQVSKAVDEERQTELMTEQNQLLKEQNRHLDRIARMMEANTNYRDTLILGK